MAFAKILQGFRSTSNLHGSSTDPEGKPVTVQLIKTPVLLEAPAVSQRKGSRLFKSLVNPKRRERETILPDFNLLEVKGPKIGLDVVKIFQDVDQKFAAYFDKAEFEPSERELRRKRSLGALRKVYQWQEPGSTNPSYPPCLKSIPKGEQNGLLQIFNAERLIDTAVAMIPDELQPKLLAAYLYGEPVGKTMAGIEARMERLRRANKNIGTEASIANRKNWYSDAVFAQQSFTGPNPTSIAQASAEWIERFKSAAKTQKKDGSYALLESSEPTSFFIQDCSYFREAANAPADAILKSDDGKRFGCASVTLFQLSDEGNLHPLAIVIDYRVSIENSVVIFNQRLNPSSSTITEEKDWPWRYAKMCSQVSDWTRHECQVHLTDCHFVEEATIVAAQRSFTADHVIYDLLEPHWLKTLSLNASARSVLVPKVVVEINGFSKAQTYSFILDAYKRFNWTAHYIPNDLKRRGFPVSQLDDHKFHNYAWARNMVPMWEVLYKFVFSVLSTTYKTDSDVVADKAIASWCAEMQSPTGGQMGTFPDIKTIDDLTNAVVMCIHIASPQHNSVNYLQCYYMSFVPNKPGCLNTPLPTTIDALMKFKELDIVEALPVHDEQVWLLSSQLPYLLSYGVSQDQTLINYAEQLEETAKENKGDEWRGIEHAAATLNSDLLQLGVVFNKHSEGMDDKIVAYNVMDPTELAVSILI